MIFSGRYGFWYGYGTRVHAITISHVNMNSVRVVHWAKYFALWQNGWCFTLNEWIKIVPIGNFPLLQNHFPAYFAIVYSVFRNFVGLSQYLYVFSSPWIYLLMDCVYFGIVTWVCSVLTIFLSEWNCQSIFLFSSVICTKLIVGHIFRLGGQICMFPAKMRQRPESENSDRKVYSR